MTKRCGHISKCGCKDTPLTTAPLCSTSPCPEPFPCPQIWDARCVIYTGDPIVDLGINPGDNLSEIFQKILLKSLNPGCVDPESTCLSVLNLFSYSVEDVSFKVQWTGVDTAITYVVEYKAATSAIWLTRPALTPPVNKDTITGLQPETEYHVRVGANCASGTCYSLTIMVKTNPL